MAAAVGAVIAQAVALHVEACGAGGDPARAEFVVVVGVQTGAVGARPGKGERARQREVGVRAGFGARGKTDAAAAARRCAVFAQIGVLPGGPLLDPYIKGLAGDLASSDAGRVGLDAGTLPGARFPGIKRAEQSCCNPPHAACLRGLALLPHLLAQQCGELAQCLGVGADQRRRLKG